MHNVVSELSDSQFILPRNTATEKWQKEEKPANIKNESNCILASLWIYVKVLEQESRAIARKLRAINNAQKTMTMFTVE